MNRKKILLRIAKYIGLVICVFVGMSIGAFWFYRDELPPTSQLRSFTLRSGSEVYDRNGKMIYLFAFEKRKLVSLKELPPYLIDALIETEDKNFYSHFGIDIKAFIRAILVDISKMGFSQGGSTITQQMARNMFLTLDKQVSRKIKEWILALRIERSFSKDEILEIYFNKIFFGGQIYGVETASLSYFGKHARDLSLPEAATLIGMIQRPNYYHPVKYPERTKLRRDFVLHQLYKAEKITADEYKTAIETPLDSERTAVKQQPSDYFIETIRTYLESKYGTDRLFEGGLKIYTTLDYDLSVYADSMLNAHLTKLENRYQYPHKFSDVDDGRFDIQTNYMQGGLVLMENKTGYVIALIGGRSFMHSKFNRITQARRQPGSSIKPIYYTIALEKGYTPATVINDGRISFRYDNKTWSPRNYTGMYYGYKRMRQAIQNSYNLYAVKTVYDLGLPAVNDAFNRFGLSINAENYTCALGTYEVIPIQLVAAFTTFPNEGVRVKPTFIIKVEDRDGKVLERSRVVRERVCTPEINYIMTSMLQTVVQSGTGVEARINYIWPVGGKTGTSDNFKDAWFIGFNREMICGIWVGFDNNRSIGAGTGGGNIAAPIWGRIMRRAMILDNKGRTPQADDPRYGFEKPDGIVEATVNSRTGFQTRYGGVTEYFIDGTVPPLVEDTLQFNFHPTRWGYNDQAILDANR